MEVGLLSREIKASRMTTTASRIFFSHGSPIELYCLRVALRRTIIGEGIYPRRKRGREEIRSTFVQELNTYIYIRIHSWIFEETINLTSTIQVSVHDFFKGIFQLFFKSRWSRQLGWWTVTLGRIWKENGKNRFFFFLVSAIRSTISTDLILISAGR